MTSWFPDPAQSEILSRSFIQQLEVFDQLPSTSDHALRHLNDYQNALPTAILARQQTDGRGRGQHRWFADDGALTFTLVLGERQMPSDPANWPWLSLLVGMAVCRALEQEVSPEHISVKWPNDVFLNGRKVCGILIERRQAFAPVVCVGVGINVNNSLVAAPDDVQKRGISLVDVTGEPLFLPGIFLRFLTEFESLMNGNRDSLEGLLDLWNRRCLLTGRSIVVQSGNRKLQGVCHGIDSHGHLQLATSNGIESVVAGEIIHW